MVAECFPNAGISSGKPSGCARGYGQFYTMITSDIGEYDLEIKVLDVKSLNRSIAVVVGTRPGIVMFAPIIHALTEARLPFQIIHTGQHYSPSMDSRFFDDLELPQPDFRVEGVAEHRTHGGQTAAMLEGVERILFQSRPRVVVVGGDANTNLAAALAARKLGVSVAHVEAGERSFDWRMPEEHNRRMIDHISDWLFASGPKASARLRREAVQGCIVETGNPIVDATLQHLDIAESKSEVLRQLGLAPGAYGILTLHREENVDVQQRLEAALHGVSTASIETDLPVIFPAHPRTVKRLKEFGIFSSVNDLPNLRLVEPMGYLDFLKLAAHAALIYTDSGGVQQEACIHHVPCVTLRDNTEWTETLEIGANRLTGTEADRIVSASREALVSERGWGNPFGNGTSARKIVACLQETLS